MVAGDITPAADLQQSNIKKRYTSVCITQRFIVSCDLHRQGMSALDPSTTESVQLRHVLTVQTYITMVRVVTSQFHTL